MGYPMTYQRMLSRNRLRGDYLLTPPDPTDRSDGAAHLRYQHAIAGDLRRLERNSRDPRHLDAYARKTGLHPEQVRAVLDAFFSSEYPTLDWEQWPPDEWGDGDTGPA